MPLPTFTPPSRPRTVTALRGKTFVFAGRLASLARREAAALVRLRGGAIKSRVSRHTDYLVVGDARAEHRSSSRKLDDVERLRAGGATIEVLSETRFLDLLGLEAASRLRNRYYSGRDIRRLYGFDGRELRALENMALVSPILRTSAERYYTFSDLLLFREIHASTRQGGSLARIARRLLQARAGQARLPLEAVRGEVLEFDPSGAATWTAEEWYNRGCEHDESPTGFQEAVRAYEKALELDPYHVGALINLGNLRYDLGDIDEARRLYERALACDPDSSIAHFNLGNVYDDLGEYRRAIRYFQSAIRLRPENADAHFNLGLVFDRLGEVSLVRQHMLMYLRLAPGGDMAEVAREYLQLTQDDPNPVLV